MDIEVVPRDTLASFYPIRRIPFSRAWRLPSGNYLSLNDLDWSETRRQHVEHYREHRRLRIVEYLFPFVAKEIRRLGL